MSAAAELRLKQKQPPVGIAAGAEDAKYQAKYKELKRKVKDIEADNDKLHFKVLQAKLSIRRMKMERAILYERLTTIPPSPTLQDRHPLPPMSVMQGGGPVGPPHPALHLRPPAGGQPQHRDYPFHPSTNVDLDQQRVGGGPAPHIHPSHHQHHHQQQPSHSRGGDPRMNLTPGIDPRNTSVDNQPAGSSPRLPVHSPPSRISSTHEGSIPRQSQHTIPPTSVPYEPRGASNIPHDNHHVHTSPALSHHNAQGGGSHSRKRSHSHSSPRATHPHQIEGHPSASHIHAAQPYRVLSGGPNNNNNPGHGSGSGTVTPAGPLGHPYPENLAPGQPPLSSPPISEMEFERGGRAHHSHPHMHQQLPHQHAHSHTHSGGGGHQHPHSQQSHHHHIMHHHHQHNHPHSTQTQAHTQNEYGGGLPVGDPPTSPPAIQAHGAGYESTGGRGTVNSGPLVPANTSGVAPAASGSGRTHAHPRERLAYDYPSTTQPEGRRERERERDGGREREREKDADREWERERDRAREYSRGELINYSPPHHRTRSSQSRPLSRAHSQSHLASGGRSQSQTATGHINPNPSGEYDHSASNSSRSRTAPSGVPPQAQYISSPEDHPQAQAYRDYPPDSNSMYTPRVAPSSRATSPGGTAVVHTTIAGPDNNSGPRDRDRDREAERDHGRQQEAPVPPPAASAGDDASDHAHQSALDSGRKRSRNEMEMEVDGEYQTNNDGEGGGRGRRNGASGNGREMSVQPQDDSRGAKRYHRRADSSPEDDRR